MSGGDEVSGIVVDQAVRIHKSLGPGLLENVYEVVLAGALAREGLRVERQKAIDIHYEGLTFPAAFRMDLLVEKRFVVEVKSVERLANVHAKQLLTYLRLSNLRFGLLLNFSGETMKEGIRRVVNGYDRP